MRAQWASFDGSALKILCAMSSDIHTSKKLIMGSSVFQLYIFISDVVTTLKYCRYFSRENFNTQF